jgi:hypothetical protein
MQQNQNDSIIDQQYNWLMKHNDRQDNGVINEQEHESKSRDESSTHNSRQHLEQAPSEYN